MYWRIGVLVLVVLLVGTVIAFGGIKWHPLKLEHFEVRQGGPETAGVTLIIHNSTTKPLHYIMIQFRPFGAYERIGRKINCTAIGPGLVEKIELGYTLGIYFFKGQELAPNSRLYCALAIKGATSEELLSYINNPGKLVYRARGLEIVP